MENIGLVRGTVRLTPHDKSWQTAFAAEAKLLQEMLGIALTRIQHVGSTSVPGILAKPIIDIAISVESLEVANQWAKPLGKIGYWDKGIEPNMPDRRFFAKGPEDKRIVYLHLATDNEYRRLVKFRDALIADGSLARQYSDLKQKLSVDHQADRAQYTHLKNDFIQSVLRQ